MQTISTSSQFNNCALHVLVPYLTAFIAPELIDTKSFQFKELAKPTPAKQEAFKQTPGYQYFRDAFIAYYGISSDLDADKLILLLLEQYPHPLDLQVLMGPVLRITLKEVLKSHSAHKEKMKSTFEKLLRFCFKKTGKIKFTGVDSIENSLTHIKWRANKQEKLFRPNISLIADIIVTGELNLSDKLWDEAYLKYTEAQSDPYKCIFVSIQQLILLGESFNFRVENSKLNSKLGNDIAFVTIKSENVSDDHWEILNNHQSNWDFKKDTPHCQSAFRNYHVMSELHLKLRQNPEKLQSFQEIFTKKIHDLLVNDRKYEEEKYRIFKGNQWANNSGLEELSTLIASFVTNENAFGIDRMVFENSSGFKDFLAAFQAYYVFDHSEKDILLSLRQLCLAYPLEKEQFIIISPVLRTMLPFGSSDRDNICFDDMIYIYLKFNLEIEMYLPRETGVVSCYDKIHHYKPDNASFKTILAIRDDKSWYFLKQDEFKDFSVTSATREYSRPFAFAEKDAYAYGRGISRFLHTGILYIETFKNRVFCTLDDDAPLHAAVLADDIELVKKRLEKFDWREDFTWSVQELPVVVPIHDLPRKVNALELAAALNNRRIATLILQHAVIDKDITLIQKAYDLACHFKHTQVLLAFLPYKVKHSYQAIENAIVEKDLALFYHLYQSGAPLFQDIYDDKSILEYLFSINSLSELKFYNIFQSLFLLLIYQQKIAPEKCFSR